MTRTPRRVVLTATTLAVIGVPGGGGADGGLEH
jgi:hypothetical protein